MTQAAVLAQLGNTPLGMRNRIINGAMMIDQRNAGASVSTSSGSAVYTLDRWNALYSQTNKFTVQQNAGSVTSAVGFKNYLGATSSSAYSVGATDFFSIRQLFEGFNTSDLEWGTANAKTVTVSFKVYSSLTGTFGGAIQNYNGTRSYPFSYTISSANTWTDINVTIAGDTSGSWIGATNGIGLQVMFSLGAGSTYSGTAGSWSTTQYFTSTGATSVVGTSGATWYITGVQLEVGETATPFEHRPYGTELTLCQRYYWKFQVDRDHHPCFMVARIASSNQINADLLFPVEMRAQPTVSTPRVQNWRLNNGTNDETANTFSTETWTRTRAYVSWTKPTGNMTQYLCGYINSEHTGNGATSIGAVLEVSAEL